MTKNNNPERDQIEMIALDQLVPQDHLARKIEAAIDFLRLRQVRINGNMNEQNSLPFRFMQQPTAMELGTIVTPCNIHDSHMLQPLVEKVIEKVKKPLTVAVDAAYKTPAITKFLFENNIQPALPYTRPKTEEGFLRKLEYVHDEYYDCYLGPEGQVLQYYTITKEGKRQYKSNATQCPTCPLLAQCTNSKDHRKIIELHI